MSIEARVVADLDGQLHELLDDLVEWQTRDDLAGFKPQLARIVRQLTSALGTDDLRKRLAKSSIDDLAPLRRKIEIVHLIWNFFRDKLMQRDTKRYRSHLAAADDLAWACYLPFATARVEVLEKQPKKIDFTELKERALVFYTIDLAAFAQPRASSFYVPGLASEDTIAFAAALQRLPVPLIGISWPQTLRVPPLAFVAHEVGHVIAQDLGVLGEVESRIRTLIPVTRREVWLAWVDELVADVFGVLFLGGAYVDQLQRTLAGRRDDIRGERVVVEPHPGRYPTRVLRIAICQRVLRCLNLDVDSLWTDTYGTPDNESAPYDKDVEAIVGAVLDDTYTALGKKLTDVLAWSNADQVNATAVARDLISEAEPVKPFSVRMWVAAAAQAQRDNAAAYAKYGLDDVALKQIFEARTKGPRASPESLRDRLARALKDGGSGSQQTPEGDDEAAGERLATLLKF